jgi:hypothetical protein
MALPARRGRRVRSRLPALETPQPFHEPSARVGLVSPIGSSELDSFDHEVVTRPRRSSSQGSERCLRELGVLHECRLHAPCPYRVATLAKRTISTPTTVRVHEQVFPAAQRLPLRQWTLSYTRWSNVAQGTVHDAGAACDEDPEGSRRPGRATRRPCGEPRVAARRGPRPLCPPGVPQHHHADRKSPRTCGVSEHLLFRHFGSQAALFRDVYPLPVSSTISAKRSGRSFPGHRRGRVRSAASCNSHPGSSRRRFELVDHSTAGLNPGEPAGHPLDGDGSTQSARKELSASNTLRQAIAAWVDPTPSRHTTKLAWSQP